MISAELETQVHDFFHAVGRREVEIYNESSLQHEFGIFLRTHLNNEGIKIQFERPTRFFGITNKLTKKEIDLSCFATPDAPLAAVEFKFPRAGQVPIQMFKFCQDVAFVEELVIKEHRFGCGLAVIAADDRDFYRGSRHQAGTIYSVFRDGAPLRGTINKPTGTSEPPVTLQREYQIHWHDDGVPGLCYAMITVTQ